MKKSIVLLFLLASTAMAGPDLAPEAAAPLRGKIIVLDPGHAVLNSAGVIVNPGARARRGAYEREVALNVAGKMIPLLEAQGAKVYMTRTAGNPWRYSSRKSADNRARAIFANVMRAHAYVRIHCDWNRSRKFKGFTTFYYRWGSRSLAKSLQKSMAEALPDRRDNGTHRRSFVSVTARMPAVLMEIGTLSHAPEAKVMATDEYQSRVAKALAEGIANYFQKT